MGDTAVTKIDIKQFFLIGMESTGFSTRNRGNYLLFQSKNSLGKANETCVEVITKAAIQ